MPGFAAAPPEAAVAAMRAVNANILGPGFAFVFFGPAILAALSAALAFAAGLGTAAWPALGAAALYAAGVIGVTFAANIPLNNALAAASVSRRNGGGGLARLRRALDRVEPPPHRRRDARPFWRRPAAAGLALRG